MRAGLWRPRHFRPAPRHLHRSLEERLLGPGARCELVRQGVHEVLGIRPKLYERRNSLAEEVIHAGIYPCQVDAAAASAAAADVAGSSETLICAAD